MGFTLKLLQTPQLFNSKPLIILSQVLENFHNKVECKQKAPCTSGCPYTTTFGGSTTTGISASLVELMLGVITLFISIVPLVIET
jgi:hypothetical protein